jgi:uncharacterized repeat protein (TIGR03803 family)
MNGTLYGTTYFGGGTGCGGRGCGTVFMISSLGVETVLYGFQGGADGEHPYAGLISVNGALYGTTSLGGGGNCPNQGSGPGCGTVFEISPTGTERVLYAFQGGLDGANPFAGLTEMNGWLYGTTFFGGGSGCQAGLGCGTVYAINPSGTESVVYRFQGGNDGEDPVYATLLNVNGKLYGTTAFGGGGNCSTGDATGCGTVFSISRSGTENVLYRFQGGSDGAFPFAGLIGVNRTLYGTTANGGGTCVNDASGCGTLFSLSTSGTETVLHRFQGQPDGEFPESTLIDLSGTLYGTTLAGGANGNGGYGTVFKSSKSGQVNVLHSFKEKQGAEPVAGLLNVSGMLYGTTAGGGIDCRQNGLHCDGTVFELTP